MADDNDTGTDVAIPDNLPAVERAIEDVEVEMRDTYTYARSPRTQARAKALYEAQERLQGEAQGTSPGDPSEQAVAMTEADVGAAIGTVGGMGQIGAAWADELGRSGGRSALEYGEEMRVAILADMGETADVVAQAFEGLDDNVRASVYRELANAYVPRLPPADKDTLAQFAETGAGKILVAEWGADAAHRLNTALFRWDRMTDDLDDTEFDEIDDFFRNRLRPHERAAVLRRLAG